MVSVFPVYLGHLLATRQIFPGALLWMRFWERSVQHGATTDEFFYTGKLFLGEAGPFLLAMLVMGPLLWAATLLINDVHDLAGDRLNWRKARSPLVQGLISRGLAHRSAYVFAALSLGTAALAGWRFAVMVGGCLVLAWLYSVPPIRLKTRPGMDVVVNAVGIGVVSVIAGWVVTQPYSTFPYAYLPQGLAVATAIYVPTTLWDYESDRRVGYLTLATHLGPRRAYLVGWWAWVLCNFGATFLSANDLIIPLRMLPFLLLFVPLMIWEYHVFIGRAKTSEGAVQGIMLCSATFFSVNMVFALMYTGMWL